MKHVRLRQELGSRSVTLSKLRLGFAQDSKMGVSVLLVNQEERLELKEYPRNSVPS